MPKSEPWLSTAATAKAAKNTQRHMSAARLRSGVHLERLDHCRCWHCWHADPSLLALFAILTGDEAHASVSLQNLEDEEAPE